MEVIELIEEMQDICEALRREGKQIRLVPTMGALHAGHGSLIRCALEDKEEDIEAAKVLTDTRLQLASNATIPQNNDGTNYTDAQQKQQRLCEQREQVVVIVSIFLNPTQFNYLDDYQNYPSSREADLELCRKLKVNYVFAPTCQQMYPCDGGKRMCKVLPPNTQLAHELEGKSRQGHFEGMLTVVCKLFNLIRPHVAYFGEKDYQQLMLVAKMSHDLNMNVKIRQVATIRNGDMLPLSSRNSRLTKREQEVAPIIHKILVNAKQALQSHHSDIRSHDGGNDLNVIIMASMLTTLCLNLDQEAAESVTVDYLEIRCAKDLCKIRYESDIEAYDCDNKCVSLRSEPNGHKERQPKLVGRILISIIVGLTRLLDNIEVTLND